MAPQGRGAALQTVTREGMVSLQCQQCRGDHPIGQCDNTKPLIRGQIDRVRQGQSTPVLAHARLSGRVMAHSASEPQTAMSAQNRLRGRFGRPLKMPGKGPGEVEETLSTPTPTGWLDCACGVAHKPNWTCRASVEMAAQVPLLGYMDAWPVQPSVQCNGVPARRLLR